MQCPQIFEHGTGRENNPLDETYKKFPLVLGVNPGSLVSYLDIGSYIYHLQQMDNPSDNPMDAFVIKGQGIYRLAEYPTQAAAHDKLNELEFNFFRSPFALKKWDPVAGEWKLLTIECQIMAAAFLSCLDKDHTKGFVDRVHQDQKIGFRCVEVYALDRNGYPDVALDAHGNPILNEQGDPTRIVDYLEVTPLLIFSDKKEEHLLLSIGNGVNFPKLKITAPATMAKAEPEFTCSICLEEVKTLVDATGNVVEEPIFRTGCGTRNGHRFHKNCAESWFDRGDHPSCPVCRTKLAYSLPVPV